MKDISITLSNNEALVLFEFLSRSFDANSKFDIIDKAEEKVLSKILGNLESRLLEPFAKNYLDLLEKARSEIRGEDAFDTE
jgi:hypothetical protein